MLPYGCSWHQGDVDVCDFLCLLPVFSLRLLHLRYEVGAALQSAVAYAGCSTTGINIALPVCSYYHTTVTIVPSTADLDLVFVNIAKIKFFFYSHKLFTEILQCDGEKEIKAEVNYINYKFA